MTGFAHKACKSGASRSLANSNTLSFPSKEKLTGHQVHPEASMPHVVLRHLAALHAGVSVA